MQLPSLSAIQESLKNEAIQALPPLNITILRNITLEPIEPYLSYLALRAGFKAKVKFGEYDNIIQEALGDGKQLFDPKTDFVLVYLWLPGFSEALTVGFSGLDGGRLKDEVQRVKDYLITAIKGIRRQTAAALLWHSFESPVYPALGIFDPMSDSSQKAIIGELNSFLRTELDSAGNAYLVEVDHCLARVGARHFYDWRYWHIGRAPFSREALAEIALEDFKYIRALKGKAKKCLVLDCDNILWGGILGEDGFDGIQIGPFFPGSPYLEFQKEALNYYHKGVILALCSKNNLDDVLKVLREHPEMLLREEHFASLRINWQDKATNLKEIAEELNIGLDSLVFVDDSDFEVNLVRSMCPEVEVIHLPQERCNENAFVLAGCGLFDTLSLSEEDRQRGQMYRAEVKRKEHLAQVTDLKSYLKSLEMEVEIYSLDEAGLPRATQLTQRTNQFNLTTRRYSESEIKRMMDSKDHDFLMLRVRDRFGEYGVTGLAILKTQEDTSEIDTFLLSCRILGRGVEEVFLRECVNLARRRGAKKVVGRYIPTKKNGQTEDFYPRFGFKPISLAEKEAVYVLAADQTLPETPEHFKRVEVRLGV